MKIIRLNEEPCDEKSVEGEFLVHWYECYGYEGLGHALVYRDDKWYTAYLGHCSCYPPFDGLDYTKPFDTLEDAMIELYASDWSNSYEDEFKKMNAEARKFLAER